MKGEKEQESNRQLPEALGYRIHPQLYRTTSNPT